MLRSFEPSPLTLYLHIPFCRSRCSYCAFNTYAGLEALIPAYISTVCREIQWVGRWTGHPQLRAIYMGGGTPSILTEAQIGDLLAAVTDAFSVAHNAEITIECNPTGVDHDYFTAIWAHGVNRLSIGAQTAAPNELKLFGRRHAWSDVIAAVKAARTAGFTNISLDLIYGAPTQTLPGWQTTLEQAVACVPQHLSLYALSLEPDTALLRKVERSQLAEAEPDIVADMYDLASEYLGRAGYGQYEISNWARPGYECIHNLQYWRRAGGYLAAGAGAYGYLDHMRYGVVDSIKDYIECIESVDRPRELRPDILSLAEDPAKAERLDEKTARAETMMLQLRLLQEGVSQREFAQRFGAPPEAYYADALRRLRSRGMLSVNADRIITCPCARLISNQVMIEFV